ncbi:MAG: NlpC/P60 family protein [Protaetiibacter sp.]
MSSRVPGWAIAVAAAALVPILVVVLVFGYTVSFFSQAQALCAPVGDSGQRVAFPVDASSTIELDVDQMAVAAQIVTAGRAVQVPDAGLQVALMVALAESKLRNLANTTLPESLELPNDGVGSDHDSVGVFQQRAGWGSVTDRMTVSWAARAFFGGPTGPNEGSPRGLLDVASWESLTPQLAAQRVQVSAFSDGSNYGRYAGTAKQLLEYLGASSSPSARCVGMGSTATGSWVAANGRSGADLVAFAEQFVGKVPYTMNCGRYGNPKVGWCCTGFVYYVYDQVLGIQVPGGYVDDQLKNFHAIPPEQAQAGDVIGWGSKHVGIYDGAGGVIHSPTFGRFLEHSDHVFTSVGGASPTFYRANALGGGSW